MPPTASEQVGACVASVDLVLEFKRFPWVLGTVSYARDRCARRDGAFACECAATMECGG
jgi:hypothetical protein